MHGRRTWWIAASAAVVFLVGYIIGPIHPRWLAGVVAVAGVIAMGLLSTAAQAWIRRRMREPYDRNNRSRVIPRGGD
jgi:hypothetical protein